MSALLVLKNPRRHGWYLPWLRDIQPVAAELDLKLLNLATPTKGHGPDFLWPTPTSPLTTIDDDLAQVQAADPRTVAEEITAHIRRLDRHAIPENLRRALTDDPAKTRDMLAAQQRLAWQTLIAPRWDQIRGLLDADITTRARRLADAGMEGLFANLHPRAEWHHDALHLTGLNPNTVDLRGRGLVLVPTAFGWPNLGIGPTNSSSTEPPALVYPMLGVGRLWERSTQNSAITRLLGTGRTSVLAGTHIPSTTNSLAQRVGLAPATVSQHLTVLRDAGLVTAQRRGREVLYQQTPLAAALLLPNPDAPSAVSTTSELRFPASGSQTGGDCTNR
ncbi:ArsR/SmtB family transcription factor [Salinispora tropica]|uniref:ArsR/SmtB family transcription factor n=1 Tax=Salinispora tropica TaxID=168695 RepID=UPI001E44DC6C|nr:DUF5937 family protein [Salinispora tropica]